MIGGLKFEGDMNQVVCYFSKVYALILHLRCA